ncbi:hypothetical protein VE01_09853 [Pseudogymnoascus verrucosus]|uniref:Inosine/uridine-preferring nucleoside hydrolase domain-containing protein n=1 Tax=Pseudogymnoascus verrucosus TaxID=342668 RepID=A0A1B8GA57_9PEZI|nr:uncharacterized protein VE01_09853 [Pseudogymnoascus verrucosus]OBT92667.1 hypothetical protein VE01_09853 [Pseudogymnoascus verrucosus]
MAPQQRIIIDTDPGVDDVLALLLALSATPEEFEVLLISVTYGNVELDSCLKNVVALFHVLEKEKEWRKSKGLPQGFTTAETFKPIVAVGTSHPLAEEILMADFFHGRDGLGGVHSSHPHLSPSDAWKSLFTKAPPGSTDSEVEKANELGTPSTAFTASKVPAYQEILRLLRENEPDTITIIAVGPLTNLAIAAAEDPETFLRVKEVVVMGGTINYPGNITPLSEFNTYADASATARIFALTSPSPSSTMPPAMPEAKTALAPYPKNLSKQLKLSLFPLDITERHLLPKSLFDTKVKPLVAAGSPLAEWVSVFMNTTYEKINSLTQGFADPGLSLHDPLTIWYMLTQSNPAWKAAPGAPEDIRVETAGQWTRGMHIVDRRNRRKLGGPKPDDASAQAQVDPSMQGDDGEGNLVNDEYGWLNVWKGNRINRIAESPGDLEFAPYLLNRIFG